MSGMKRRALNDIDLCLAGRCIGGRCPCLCHIETLHLAHYDGYLVRRRGRVRGVSPWKKARARRAP
jgi:hypothetical protein